jgi:hypothetical protein
MPLVRFACPVLAQLLACLALFVTGRTHDRHRMLRTAHLRDAFGELHDVLHQLRDELLRHRLLHHYTEDLHLREIGRELVVRHNPTLSAEEGLHPALLHMRVLLLKVIREAEGDDGEAGLVRFDVGLVDVGVDAHSGLSVLDEAALARCRVVVDEAVDVGEYSVIARNLKGSGEQPGVFEIVKCDGTEAFEAEMNLVQKKANIACEHMAQRMKETYTLTKLKY